VSLGPATDIAEAILLDPGIVERVEVIAMAFDSWPEGGDPWNVRNDPEAFRIVLRSAVPLTIGPARTCLGPLNLDMETASELTRRGGERGALLLSRLEEWLRREAALTARTTGGSAWPLWDLVTVAHILGYTTVERRQRPRLRDDLSFDLSRTTSDMGWITEVDGAGLWEDFAERLARDP
jgi:inosine-uridine nucleoside N-ribohydrolase